MLAQPKINRSRMYKGVPCFWARTVPALAVLALPAWTATISTTVPGTADVFLAGQPNGSTVGDDIAPTNSPVLASGIRLTAGGFLTFLATGSTSLFGSPMGSGGAATPDGNPGGFGSIGENKLSGLDGPSDSLIGVFIGAGLPSGSAPATLDFSTPAATSAATISPLLQQIFFIGDGLTGTGSGSSQHFTIPAGATRLFLGSLDGAGANFNNEGTFIVTVDDQTVPASATPEPGTALLLLPPAVVLLALRRRLLPANLE